MANIMRLGGGGGGVSYTWNKYTEKPVLPDEYTLLEYIESTGTQYIDTGWKPTNMNFEIESQFKITGTAEDQVIFGAGLSDGDAGFTLNAMVGSNTWQLGINNIWQTVTHSSCAVNKDIAFVAKGSSSGTTLTVNGTLVTTNTQTTISDARSVSLFAVNSSQGMLYPATARMYSFKVRDNGTLVRDMIPCKNASGTVGLYDKVSGEFYTNTGSGTFVAGSVINPLVGQVNSKDINAYPYKGFQDGYYYEAVGESTTITESGTYDVRPYVTANVNVQSAPVLLWTNASPASSFAAQTISVPSGYSAYLVEVRGSDSSLATYTEVTYVPIGQKKLLCLRITGAMSSATGQRDATGSATGVVFGAGYKDNTQLAQYCIPQRIWGVKFAL